MHAMWTQCPHSAHTLQSHSQSHSQMQMQCKNSLKEPNFWHRARACTKSSTGATFILYFLRSASTSPPGKDPKIKPMNPIALPWTSQTRLATSIHHMEQHGMMLGSMNCVLNAACFYYERYYCLAHDLGHSSRKWSSPPVRPVSAPRRASQWHAIPLPLLLFIWVFEPGARALKVRGMPTLLVSSELNYLESPK